MRQPRETVSKTRLESFSDGVIAVIITVLVLNLRAPNTAGWAAWWPGLLPALIYAIGFQLTAAMWLLHHNTFTHLQHVNRKVIWANFVFLLLLSLFPITVEAVSLHPRDPADLVVLCGNILLCAISLSLLRLASVRDHSDDLEFNEWNANRSKLAAVGLGSMLLATALAFYSTFAALTVIASILILVLVTG